tara:strand:+ start:1660 stop:1854 length:195 start_codon:yes stop_codon:yes gene_type:complete
VSEKIRIGDLIKFNYLFSNENDKIGIVYSIKKDYNFSQIIEIVSDDEILQLPFSLIDYKILERK